MIVTEDMKMRHSPMNMDESPIITAERAYRRGCSQSVSMLRQFMEEKGIEPGNLIREFEEILYDMRIKMKPHDWYLHVAIDKLSKKCK